MSTEHSESGAPIYKHQHREEGWRPPNTSDSHMEDIDKHIETHLGKITMIYHEAISDTVHIDIHQIPPSENRPYWTLVTSGMSDLPMTTPEGREEFRYAELMLCLPPTWKMNQEDWKSEENYWPVRWLKICARFPHAYKTWLCWGHTLPNSNPPRAYSSNTQFCCMMLGIPRTTPKDFWSLEIRPNKIIRFYALYPLYGGETEMKLKKSAEHLEDLFDKNKISEVIDLKRPDLSAKSWWKPW